MIIKIPRLRIKHTKEISRDYPQKLAGKNEIALYLNW